MLDYSCGKYDGRAESGQVMLLQSDKERLTLKRQNKADYSFVSYGH